MTEQRATYHIPVMLREAVDGLAVRPAGVYVDATFGGGGHAREILGRLGAGGRLIAIDQDADAQQNAAAIGDRRLTAVQGSFRFLRSYLRYHGAPEVDGILADLGVSWHQFDTAERGFSFRFEAALDMRMNRGGGRTAATLVNTGSVEELSRVLGSYGEVDNPRRVATLIVAAREQSPIHSVGRLVEALAPALPRVDEHRWLAKVFQALRIEVNGELRALEQLLAQAGRVLRPGGRLAVISYHSLEDRMVKSFIRSGSVGGCAQKDFYGRVCAPLEAVNKKVVLPAEDEVRRNPRARSAKLRIAQKR